MKRTVCVIVAMALGTLTVLAQRIETVDAHAVFTAPPTMPPKEARFQTILSAQVDAVARTFGTTVSDENLSFVREKDRTSSSDFFSLHEGDVRGVWLETVGDTIWSEPKHRNDGSVVYEVNLKGKIMELKSAPIAIQTKLLFNGTDPIRNEIRDYTFHDGDDMYMYFKTPVDGYLAVYIVDYDDNMTTQRILPYQGEPEGIHRVSADKEYILFSEEKAEYNVKSLVRRCVMRGRTNHDYNQFYVIFSPNPFVKATDQTIDENLPSILSFKDFQKWLSKNRRKDLQMCVEKIFVDIIKNQDDTKNAATLSHDNNPSEKAQHPYVMNKKQKNDLKTLQKEGWKTIEDGGEIETQFVKWQKIESEQNVDYTEKYLTVFSEVEDENLQIAERRAWDDACSSIRNKEHAQISGSIKAENSSASTSNGNSVSHSDVVASQRSKTNYSGTMNDLIKVMAIYKKTKTGYIVRMVVAKENK